MGEKKKGRGEWWCKRDENSLQRGGWKTFRARGWKKANPSIRCDETPKVSPQFKDSL